MFKKFLLFLMAVIMTVSMVSFAVADELEPPVTEDPDIPGIVIENNHWKTVYTGNGSAVNLTIENTTGLYFDIKMTDYSGTIVWSQYHSVTPWNICYYYVGSNVKTVELIGSDGISAGIVYVSWNYA